jgi:hypothetical protein
MAYAFVLVKKIGSYLSNIILCNNNFLLGSWRLLKKIKNSKLRANIERSNKPSNLFYSFNGEWRNIPRNKIDYVIQNWEQT